MTISETSDIASKAWYQSKTIWGAIVAFVCTVLGYFSVDISTEFQEHVVELAMQAGAVVGAGFAIYGRIVAQDGITIKKEKRDAE